MLKRMLTKKFNVGIDINKDIENGMQKVSFSAKEANLIHCLNYVHTLYVQYEEKSDAMCKPVILEQQRGRHFYVLDHYLQYRPQITNYTYKIIE